MGGDFRIVIDTNVFVSQLLLPKSIPAAVVRLALRRGMVLSSAEHLAELFKVAMRPKFAQPRPRRRSPVVGPAYRT